MYDLSDELEYAREVRADKIERYRQDRYNASKQGDIEFLDYLSSDEHQELLAVIHRHWQKLERCGLSPRNGGGYDDLLVRRDAIEAIDIAWDSAIHKSIDHEIARGHANEFEPDENPNDPRDELV